jgi:uncharacterized protein
MARDGYLIFDSDTHVGPSMDLLEPYLSAAELEALEPWRAFRKENKRDAAGRLTYLMGARKYDRRLGDAEPAPRPANSYMGRAEHPVEEEGPHPLVDHDPALRIADMDREGVDVNLLLPSGWFGCWTTVDSQVELALYRAYNRWLADFCAAYPDRLTGALLVPGRDVEAGLAELKRCAGEPWALALFVYTPAEMPLDHPSLEPYWAAAQEYDLAVALHTFTVMPPYAPGGLDTWDNLWLQRSAAHPWCGMRNMASLIGCGVLDRYPNLRLAVLEAGHSWLPFWMRRLDSQALSMGPRGALPPLRRKPSEYVTSGRFFQSIEMAEGADLTTDVVDVVGEDVLMYASDYPHDECWFPKSVDAVMAWDMPESRRRKLLWDNATRLYRRYSGVANVASV